MIRIARTPPRVWPQLTHLPRVGYSFTLLHLNPGRTCFRVRLPAGADARRGYGNTLVYSRGAAALVALGVFLTASLLPLARGSVLAQGSDSGPTGASGSNSSDKNRDIGQPGALLPSKAQPTYESLSRNIYSLLESDASKNNSEQNSASSEPMSYAWYNDLVQTLGSLTAGFIPGVGLPGQTERPASDSEGQRGMEEISWLSGIKARLESLSREIQNTDWARESQNEAPSEDRASSSTIHPPTAGLSLKDQLLDQISTLQSQLNDSINDTRATLSDAMQGMLPDQLRRPWLSACAGLYLDRDIYPEIGKPAECRLGSSICSEEAEFRQKRAERVRKDFAEFIGVPEAAIDSRDVPVIAVAGSGGGFRAMVSSIGSLRAMYSAGLLQCVMYNAAVSGSSWAFAALHTYANGNPYAVLDNVRQAMQSSMFNTSSLVSFVTNNDNVAKRVFVDIAARYILSAAISEDMLRAKVDAVKEPPSSPPIDISSEKAQLGLMDRLVCEMKKQAGRAADFVSPEQGQSHARHAKTEELAPLTMDELLAAAKNTLLSMSVPPLSIVELYGALLFKQLLVQRTADADGNPKLSLDPQWMKLSSQRNGVDSGDLPMPIYTAVRHFIGSTDNQAKDAAAEGSHHRYQWFEFSPYEVGSIEHGAWVPTWGLGRPMENGKDLLRVGEIHFGSIMGTVASAFCASVKAMVMEIYLACPGPVRAAMDPLLDRLDYDTSVAHPIPPYTLFNPFYRTDERRSGPHELVELESQPFLSLMDAGLENNLPFAPLLRPARGVDIIICLDSSANIEAMPWFARAESWAKEHNVQRWPWGARPWKADPLRPSRAELELASGPGKAAVKDAASRTEDSMLASNARCAIFDKPLAPSPFQPSLEPPITIVYLPLLPNKQFRDPDFDPAEAGFCATFNDQWTSEQVDKLADLTSLNFTQELDSIRKAMRRAYERKRAWREYLEKHQHQQ